MKPSLSLRGRILLALGPLAAIVLALAILGIKLADEPGENATMDALLGLLVLPAVLGAIAVARALRAREQWELQLHGASEILRETLTEQRDLYDHAPCGYHSI